jgi:glycosyltransferase involved in cell wall biosynthesis
MIARRPRIAVLANTLERGAGPDAGGHVHFLEIVQRWTWADIVIFAPESGRIPFLHRVSRAAFVAMPSCDGLVENKAAQFLFRAVAGLSMWKELRRCDALVSTSHGLPDVLPAIVFRRRRGLVIVHHLIDTAKHRNGPPVRNMIAFAAERVSLAIAARTFGAVACSSKLAAASLRNLGFKQPIVITTSGVDHIERPSGASAPRTGAVFVGRLHPTKGVDDLVRAWRLVADALPEARLTLIGASDDREFERQLDALIAILGLRDNVLKLGRVPDDVKDACLYAARAFAFPSKEEGWGIALAEAMRAGLPAVTYALPVFDEIFPRGRLSSPIADVGAFATNLIRILTDDELHARLAEEASSLAEGFTWQQAADAEASALRALISR